MAGGQTGLSGLCRGLPNWSWACAVGPAAPGLHLGPRGLPQVWGDPGQGGDAEWDPNSNSHHSLIPPALRFASPMRSCQQHPHLGLGVHGLNPHTPSSSPSILTPLLPAPPVSSLCPWGVPGSEHSLTQLSWLPSLLSHPHISGYPHSANLSECPI